MIFNVELEQGFETGEIERAHWKTYASAFFELSWEQYEWLSDRLWGAVAMQDELRLSLQAKREFRRWSLRRFASSLKSLSTNQMFDLELEQAAKIANVSDDQAKLFFFEEWSVINESESREEAYAKSGLAPFLVTVDTFNTRVAEVSAKGLNLPSHLRAQNNLSFNSNLGREKRFRALSLQLMINFKHI